MSIISETADALVLCGLTYLVFLLIKYRNRAIGTSDRKNPVFPTLPGWPLFGQLPDNIKNRSRSLEFSASLKLKHGPGYSFTLPGTRLIDISMPEWIEYVEKTNFNNYLKGDLFQSVMFDVFGEGIFVIDGPKWKLSRHSTSTIFTNNSFKDIIVPSTNKTMDGLLKVLNGAAAKNLSLDFCDLFFSIHTRRICTNDLGQGSGTV